MCCYLYRMVAEFKVACNFEGTSTASNYGTVSKSDEWISISISISISIVPGFTTSRAPDKPSGVDHSKEA